MKLQSALLTAAILVLLNFYSSATTLYVDLNSANPTPPYADWSTAATNIQDAVDASTNGDLVLVTNGIYQTGGSSALGFSNRVYVSVQNVTVQSVNGPAVTVIEGSQGTTNGVGAVRGVFLASNSSLSGFTVTGGATYVSDNYGGGGIDCQTTAAIVTNCIITGNASGRGGGVNSGTLNNCVISQNTGTSGGGVYMSQLNNCLVVGNTATYGGGGYGGIYDNCTIVTNTASNSGGGVYGGTGATLNNSIIYFNAAPASPNLSGAKFNYSCSTPPLLGAGDITNDPAFVNLVAGDFHLSPLSPCINAGTNSSVNTGTDLDGNARIVAGIVDMGAYEFQSPIHYVNVSNTAPVSPFLNWAAAATNIQDAIDAATNGDLVLVTNGIYSIGGRPVNGNALTNRVALTKPLSVQSVNGSTVTVIQGYQVPGTTTGDSAVRCAYLTNGASLVGFTLEGGATRAVANGSADGIGGGIWCESLNSFVTNCVIVGNASGYAGGGAYQGTFTACVLSNNLAIQGRGFGGGAYQSTLMKSVLVGNVAFVDGSGADACTLYNCLLYSNNPAGANGGVLVNCTIANNIGVGATYTTILTNCIVYNNSAGIGSGFYAFCCVSSLPARGIGNITNEPAFVNLAGGDFHLQSNSPCINAGNNSYVTSATDLDGNPRIVGGTVDIGAYEYQTPSSILSYAWAQQYGLPTDGSADYADSDGDGMNNWQEWIAGTNPTNASSLLQMLSPTPTNNSSGITISWQSVSGINYFLQRGSDLSAQPIFSTIQNNIVGQAGTTSYTDTTATNGGPYFYRVGVQ